MGFKNFKLNIVLRVIGMCATIFVLTALALSGFIVTVLFFALVLIYQVYSLISLMDKTNREMVGFLSSIKYDDFSQFYHLQGRGESFDELNEEFNKVLSRFKEVRADKEADYQYFKNIIHHIGIGILSFDKQGRVNIINTAGKRLFKVDRLHKIDNLSSFSEELPDKIKKLRTGEKALVRVKYKEEVIQLAVFAIELYLKGDVYKLVTVQNIHSELEEQEMEAWQNLIRVLTHEIMNSVTPISSLAHTVADEIVYLKEKKAEGETIEEDDLEDVSMAVETIKRRSDGMIRFVNEFRNLAHIPSPKLQHIDVSTVFQDIRRLMEKDCENSDIDFTCSISPDNIVITIDPDQIEQVLINLVKNAVQAFQEVDRETKRIEMIAGLGEGDRPFIKVKDNGIGIEKETLERIFIPFFTTKKEGSGIGLSLSRQIMRQHKGSITVTSSSEEGTEFTLKF